jgi:hypothetical protein
MNKIISTRNAIKDADYFGRRGRTYTADMKVTTFTDEDGDPAKIVSGVISLPIGGIHLNNKIREESIQTSASFHEDNISGGSSEVYTTSSSVFSGHMKRMAVTISEGDKYGLANGSEMNLFLSPETARQMAEAILAQLAEDEGVQA